MSVVPDTNYVASRSDNPVAIQRQYYTRTAADYDGMHAGEADSQPDTMEAVCALLRMVEPRTLLDVGCGTGRGIECLREKFPSFSVFGVEPVRALIDQTLIKRRAQEGTIFQGVGAQLPFADRSVDVVCSFGMLHHVRKPDEIVEEMVRVARKAVLIVDSNRFGQGRWLMWILKLALYKAGLWNAVNYVKTRGKGYMINEGDGVAYSYSLYDSLDCLAKGSERLFILPSESGHAKSWFHPLVTSPGLIGFAMKGLCR